MFIRLNVIEIQWDDNRFIMTIIIYNCISLSGASIPWLHVIISVVTISVIMATLGGLYFTQKHLCRIRYEYKLFCFFYIINEYKCFFQYHCLCNKELYLCIHSPATPSESKAPQVCRVYTISCIMFHVLASSLL